VTFFLDECLPYQIAYWLQRVGHPITCWHEEFHGQQGLKEPYLIPYLGAKSYTWITKDDEAKKEHESEIRTAGINVVWLRGLARAKGQPKKNKISIKDVNRMLTDKLDTITQALQSTKKPIYYLMWMASGGKPVLKKITLEEFFKKIE
jgi:predicted nuclease of predicted toxin-antitoxin system